MAPSYQPHKCKKRSPLKKLLRNKIKLEMTVTHEVRCARLKNGFVNFLHEETATSTPPMTAAAPPGAARRLLLAELPPSGAARFSRQTFCGDCFWTCALSSFVVGFRVSLPYGGDT